MNKSSLALSDEEQPVYPMRWFWGAVKTPPRVPLSEWADKYRYLSLESNPTGGRWRTETTPYLREILDCLSDEEHEKVVVQAPSQFGKSECILNLVGEIMHLDPGPVLIVQETIDNARSWSKDRLVPMLRDTPALRGKISSARGKTIAEDVTSNEALHKTFPGGHITAVGSNSGAGLSMRPIRYVLCDEIDAWELSAGEEGDQLSLAEKRTTWFFNRKIVVISSPRLKATSRIEPLYLQSDQRKLYVPCPHCGYFQQLLFPSLKWEMSADRLPIPESVHFACMKCSRRIEEQHRAAMLAACEWRAKFPGREIAGFQTWAVHCPPVPWAALAREYVTDHKDPEKYKVFVNTRLAETWEEPSDAPAWEPLKERAQLEGLQQWVVPHGVGFLTVGADVQGDRIEFSVWGWGAGSESWLIGHDIIYGNTDTEEPYLTFEARAFIPYNQPSRNRTLSPLLACIDTGYNSQEVYWFCRTRPHIYAVKGSSPAQAAVVSAPSWQDIDYKGRKQKAGVQLWTVGVSRIKRNFYGRLRNRTPGPRFVHFPADLDDEYFRQITAEKIVTGINKGYPTQEWKKTYDNECLDCSNYAYAAAVLAGLEDPRTDWTALTPGYTPQPLPFPEVPETEPNLQPVTVGVAREEQPRPQPVTVAPPRAVTMPMPQIPVRGRGVRGAGGTLARLLRR